MSISSALDIPEPISDFDDRQLPLQCRRVLITLSSATLMYQVFRLILSLLIYRKLNQVRNYWLIIIQRYKKHGKTNANNLDNSSLNTSITNCEQQLKLDSLEQQLQIMNWVEFIIDTILESIQTLRFRSNIKLDNSIPSLSKSNPSLKMYSSSTQTFKTEYAVPNNLNPTSVSDAQIVEYLYSKSCRVECAWCMTGTKSKLAYNKAIRKFTLYQFGIILTNLICKFVLFINLIHNNFNFYVRFNCIFT